MTTLHAAHLYGNLMNTYSDIGNLLVLRYYANKIGVNMTIDCISTEETFDDTQYDFVLFGGGQDFEQSVVSKDLQTKAEALKRYIENDGVLLAICGGYQLLGQYYIGADGKKLPGAGVLPHYTVGQNDHRFIGNITIHNDLFDEDYIGFENHSGRTFLGEGQQPLGTVLTGNGNNGEDKGEGMLYKHTFGTYFHGPILARNPKLAIHLLNLALQQQLGKNAPQASLDLITHLA